MNWSKFKLKKICTIFQVSDSYHFNCKHSARSYLNTIQIILDNYDLLDGATLAGYCKYDDHFIATFTRTNPAGNDFLCQIDFDTTTLSIIVIE